MIRSDASSARLLWRKLLCARVGEVICCPTGCPGGNSFALSMAPDPQLMVFNVALDPDERHDLRHAPEAASLMWLLPGSYAKARGAGRGLCRRDTGTRRRASGTTTTGSHFLKYAHQRQNLRVARVSVKI